MAFSPDNYVSLWNVKTGNHIKNLQGHTKAISALAYSHDGKYLASGSIDTKIIVWETKKLRKSATYALKESRGLINTLDFSVDSKTLVAGQSNGELLFWNIAQDSSGIALLSHQGALNKVLYSDTGKVLATAGEDM